MGKVGVHHVMDGFINNTLAEVERVVYEIYNALDGIGILEERWK